MKNNNFEAHRRMVAAGLKKLGVKESQEADLEILMRRARESISKVRSYAIVIVEEHRQAGKDVDRVFLAKDITDRFLSEFRGYDKDELLQVLVIFSSQLCLNEVI
jgi:hypothetical protein